MINNENDNGKPEVFVLTILFVGLAALVAMRGFVSSSPGELSDKKWLSSEFKIETAIERLRQENVPFQLPLYEKLREELISWGGDFIEVNLAQMKTRTYRGGVIEEEYSILARGDSEDWGGSPAGLYAVNAKYQTAFSVSALAYMPFSIGYYGQYYFHGIPYYKNGTKIVSRYSRGCLRHSDKDAKKIFDFSSEGMPVLVIDSERDNFDYRQDEVAPFPELSAENYIIADVDSGFVFAERGSVKKLPIASITKLMTATVIIENSGIDRSTIATPEMLDVYGSNPGFEVGKRYFISQLLHPLLTRSSNQAAEILAYFMGKEDTLRLMNEKAKNIMMYDTHFSDTSGLSENNISTARDLFYLLRYISYNRSPLWKIAKGEYVRSSGAMLFDNEELGNRNIFIYDPTFVGGKTGYTNAAKHTGAFIFSFEIEDETRNVAMIFLQSNNVKSDTQKVYKWLLENYFPRH